MKRKKYKHEYKSNSEYEAAQQLHKLKIAFEYERDTLPYEWREDKKYTPDFFLPNGVVLEVKGRFMAEDRKKHLLVREQHPHLDIRLVFMNAANKIRKGSDTTYACWCEKKGIKYADKVIPKSWLSQKRTNRVVSAGRVTLEQQTMTEAPIVSVVKVIVEDEEE